MIVGICTIELHIPESGSLKAKRQVLRSLKDRLHRGFNVSVAEVEAQDLWQRAVLGVACAGNEKRHVNQVLDKVVDWVEKTPSVEVIACHIEFV